MNRVRADIHTGFHYDITCEPAIFQQAKKSGVVHVFIVPIAILRATDVSLSRSGNSPQVRGNIFFNPSEEQTEIK